MKNKVLHPSSMCECGHDVSGHAPAGHCRQIVHIESINCTMTCDCRQPRQTKTVIP